MPTYQALLIGIDHYVPSQSNVHVPPGLRGAVADVDLLSEELVRLGIPDGAITRLVAPRPNAARGRATDERDASAATVRQALAQLAQAKPGDRVLVYFAGHGTQFSVHVNQQEHWFGAIVASDCHAIPDHELGCLLDAIYDACNDLTVILDCCHSADAARGPDRPLVRACSHLGLSWDSGAQSPRSPLGPPSEHDKVGVLRRGRSPGYTVIAACQVHEKAIEKPINDRWHGVFTLALCEALHACSSRLSVATDGLTWAEFWPTLLATLEPLLPLGSTQRPTRLGPSNNRVLGGPPAAPSDTLPVYRKQDSGQEPRYVIEAGSLAGLEPGDQVAPKIHRPDEASDPPRPVLEVCEVEPWQSIARVLPPNAAAVLGDRCEARIVRARALSLQLSPDLPTWIRDHIRKHAAADHLNLSEDPRDSSWEAQLGMDEGGLALWLREPPLGGSGTARCLWKRPVPQSEGEAWGQRLRALLRHCAAYVRPLRVLSRVYAEDFGKNTVWGLRLQWVPQSFTLLVFNESRFRLDIQIFLVLAEGRILNLSEDEHLSTSLDPQKNFSISTNIWRKFSSRLPHQLIGFGKTTPITHSLPFVFDQTFNETWDLALARSGSQAALHNTAGHLDWQWYVANAVLDLSGLEPPLEPPPIPIYRRTALLVAVPEPDKDEHQQTTPAQYSDNDVHQISRAMGLIGFCNIDIHTLPHADRKRPITKKLIIEWIKEHRPTEANSLLWFHFSGHGFWDEQRRRTILCLQKEERKDPLSLEDLIAALHPNAQEPGRCLLTIDACGMQRPSQDAAPVDLLYASNRSLQTHGSTYREMGRLSYYIISALRGTHLQRHLTRDGLFHAVKEHARLDAGNQDSSWHPIFSPHEGDYYIQSNDSEQAKNHAVAPILDLHAITEEQLKTLIENIVRMINKINSSSKPEYTNLKHKSQDLAVFNRSEDQPRIRALIIIQDLSRELSHLLKNPCEPERETLQKIQDKLQQYKSGNKFD